MFIETTRFGRVELSEEDVLLFSEGLLGFNNFRKFVLIDDPTDEIFVWLQSCENPAIAFPVLEPELYQPNYQVQMVKADLASLELGANDTYRLFSIITIPEDPTLMTANMKAPLVINVRNRKARQCVLQDNNLAIREPIFAKLQQRLTSNPNDRIRSQALDWGVAVPLAGTTTVAESQVAASIPAVKPAPEAPSEA